MTFRYLFRIVAVAALLLVCVMPAGASIVRFETSLGSFDVQLYDDTTPATVANFLSYVNAGDYDGSFIHRSIPNFVVQGGGFLWDEDTQGPMDVEERDSVINEPVHSNVRGTIAMAKLGGDPDSATSQWFFNLGDNNDPDDPYSLDNQNGGFTVFGHVIGDGMDVIDAIAQVPTYNVDNGVFSNLPLVDIDTQYIEKRHLVMIESVVETPEPAALSILSLAAACCIRRR